MPSASPTLTDLAAEALVALGKTVRTRRKALGISAVATSEAAGISRVTLHRIEKGEPSVTMGACMATCVALGLRVLVAPPEAQKDNAASDRKDWIPVRVRLADYAKLKELAWQVHGTPELTPREALGIYERNWRHVDPASLSESERHLIDALRQGLGSTELV